MGCGSCRSKVRIRTAAEWMGVSERWVRKLLSRMRKKGDRVMIHGLRGKPSQQRIDRAVRARAVHLVRAEYLDFGPKLGGRISGQRASPHGEPGNVAPVDDGGWDLDREKSALPSRTYLAGAAELLRSSGEVGHQ
jgi:hypothetical protein